VFHVKLATPRHPLIGETWLAALAAELAQRGAITRAQTTYAANTRPSGLLTTDLVLTAAQVDELRARWQTQSAQMAEGGVPILTAGLKFQPVTMSAEDSQTIEQLKLTNAAVAAVFGVPAILLGIGDTATQKSAEAVMAEWLAAGLGWLINHVEVAFDAFIGLNAVPAGREWTEFDTRALLRSLYKERIEGLVRGVQGGIYSPNEARALEGYGAVKAGAEPRVQQQVVPLSFALEPPKPPTPPALPPGEENPDAEDDDEAEDDAELDEDAADEARVLTTYRLRKHMDSINAERRAA
jgi:HK97 family phage portal protein